jgi:hypothetical protein
MTTSRVNTLMAPSGDVSPEWRRLIDRDEIDALFGTANPNPDRTGCPSQRTLAALARRRRDLGDPAYEHLAHCSPCYQQFRLLQGDVGAKNRGAWWLAVAAAILLAVAGAWVYRAQHPVTPPTSPTATVARAVELDLRPYATSRSVSPRTALPSLPLSRDELHLTLLLPVGAEPGSYDVRLLDTSSRVLASASGQARIQDFVTTLQVTLDLRTVAAGDRQIAVRHAGEGWHVYPASVR